jgi:hypothetical protein
MSELRTLDTGVPIYRRSKPHIFFSGGEWRVWFRAGMKADPVIRAHEYARRLSGLSPSYQPSARNT